MLGKANYCGLRHLASVECRLLHRYKQLAKKEARMCSTDSSPIPQVSFCSVRTTSGKEHFFFRKSRNDLAVIELPLMRKYSITLYKLARNIDLIADKTRFSKHSLKLNN
ncbi:hypothetical protein TNIN_115631 [Trichonephila inaurata madagascariensis]|uniref:Uncharacterized protein n=1 Tax=Trichonephila inaurata madagascariensis TaxID=2747483 RepID=A0A8X7BXP9_9ARAC|nr:hypothetical protein TNIN_115631 [Trichonephila inaurata madagascariensis]